jgi:hypothetical protein
MPNLTGDSSELQILFHLRRCSIPQVSLHCIRLYEEPVLLHNTEFGGTQRGDTHFCACLWLIKIW